VKAIDWDSWLYSPGMPLEIPEYDTSLSSACIELANKWKDTSVGRSSADIKNMSSSQVIFFLTKLREGGTIPADSARRLTEIYSLKQVKNSEIRYNWIRINLQAHVSEIVPQVR